MLKRIAFATALFIPPVGAATAQSLEDIFAPAAKDGVVPMEDILASARLAVDGVIMEVELEQKKGRWIYEVEVVARDKEKIELTYDARSGALLSRKRD